VGAAARHLPLSFLELSATSHPPSTTCLLNPLENYQKPCMPSPCWAALRTSRTLTKQAYKAEACPVGITTNMLLPSAPKTRKLPQPLAPSTNSQCRLNPQHAEHSSASHLAQSDNPARKAVGPKAAPLQDTHQNPTQSCESTIEKKNNNFLVNTRCIQGSHAGSSTLPVLRKYAAGPGGSLC
jgi:hypothetical protein